MVLFSINLAGGFLLDRFGRKWLTITGQIMYGFFLIGLPFMQTIYPGIFVLNILSKIFGLAFITNSPFLSDYVMPESIGGTVAICGMIESTSKLAVNSGYIWLQKEFNFDFSWLFLGTGLFIVLSSLPMICGLQEVSKKKNSD